MRFNEVKLHAPYPTRRSEFAKAGDSVMSVIGGMRGEVVRVITTAGSIPYALVKWENGHTGRVTITSIARVNNEI